ncbi:MAG: two-component sensor histidine kinase [Nocardioidaceae bacterium]|nr:two-component sensor histidine kinase [Nocardioidaceae bacterium]
MDNIGPLVTLLLGAVIGGLVVWWWRLREHQRVTVPVPPEPAVPPGVASLLTILPSSAVLVGDDDSVLDASAPALALGLVRNDRLMPPQLLEVVRSVRRDGRIRDLELVLRRSRSALSLQVTARVAPLGRLVLVLAEDRTHERRVEVIRRDFVANVSHELKTPVGALTLLSEAVAEAADDPAAVRRFAGRMHSESGRLSRLVQQIIALSRLQGDELIHEPTSVDVGALIDTSLDRVRTDAESRGVTLVSRVDPGLTVPGNPDQILVAVSNLVDNAVVYSPEGGRVAVMAGHARDRVTITVSDQGIGIPHDELDRIFERFYRVDPARARATGGTGLGLSITKHIAASHGGEVTVWSVENQGSSFTLSLPAINPEDTESLSDLWSAPMAVEVRTPEEASS